MLRTRGVAVVAALAALAGRTPEADAAETPARFRVKSFAEVMAPTTIFYLEIPDYARARAAYRATPRWKLWWEGAGRRMISQLIRSEGDDDWTAGWRAFAESAKLPTGKLAVAIEGPNPDDEFGMPTGSFLAEVGGKANAFTGLIRNLMLGGGFVEEDETVIQRVRFEQITDLLVGSEGGLVIGGAGRTSLNDLLSRFAERPWQSLAGNPAYKLAKARALEGAHFMTFTNYTDIWRMLAMEFDEDWLPIQRTGLPQLAATSLSGRFTPEGVVDKLSFILRGRARGIWKLLRPEPLSRRAWQILPDFTSGFVAMKLPGRTQPFLKMLRALDPEMAADFLESFRAFREETGINIERDLLSLTTGEFTAVFLEEDPDRKPDVARDRRHAAMMGEEKLQRHIVLLVELKNPAKARAAMDQMAKRMAEFDFGGKRSFGRLKGWKLGDGIQGPFYAAGLGNIGMLALSPEPIERLAAHIAKRGPRLVDSAEFRKATAWIPADTGFAAYSNVGKIMRSLHKFISAETGKRGRAPVELPKVEELMADLTPLTACVHIEKPGFAFEIHSPDGIWPFYFQLMAHCFWRFEQEPMQARRQARAWQRARVLPPVAGSGADPKVVKAYNDLNRRVAKIVTPQLKIAELQRGIAQFEGTPYKKLIESTITREKNKLLRDMLSKMISTAQRIKDPEAKAAFLRTNRPKFADTRYGRIIDLMIKRAEAERDELEPVEDEDDVF